MNGRWLAMAAAAAVAVAMATGGCASSTGPEGGDDDDVAMQPDASAGPVEPDIDAAGPAVPDIDAAGPVVPDIDAAASAAGAPGTACGCDTDCQSVDGHAGICVYGVCMTRASATCSAAGSTAECAAGSRCWGLQDHDGAICWPDCASYGCDGTCDGDGSCVPTAASDCTYSCGSYCSCTDGDCPEGEMCSAGNCVPEVITGDGPGPGPGPACPGLPPMTCTGTASYCGQLIAFDPHTTANYDDYPINGETAGNQYRSFLRRDLVTLLKYATAKVSCKAAAWDTGIGGPEGLGDMSEATGAIPGTSVGAPGHPAGTHTNGHDIDVGYFQIGTPDNHLRPICNHTDASGADAQHCTADPTSLDVWRSAMLLGVVFEHPNIRVVGVDGRAGPLIMGALDQLCTDGWLTPFACSNISLAYETTDMGYGWYYFHHHHMHISIADPAVTSARSPIECEQPGCAGVPVKPHPHRFGPVR